MSGHHNNDDAVKHGGEAGVNALREHRPFRGMAASAEIEAQNDLDTLQVVGLERRQAVRLEAVTRLYYDAFLAAAESNDLAGMDRYAARYGWLAGVSLRAWAQVKQSERGSEGHNAVDAALKSLEAKNEQDK